MDNGIENRNGNGNGNEPGISLIDRTSSSQPDNPQSRDPSRRFTRRWNRNRKYAKWQAPKSGVDTSSSQSVTQTQTQTSEPDGTPVKGKNGGGKTPRGGSSQDIDTMDFATSEQGESNGNGSGNGTEINGKKTNKPDQTIRELDILYENQRGWFLFGIPLYSHGSLLNFDPSAWVTRDLNDSPVNITNAQLPDPSWEWVWHTWYVDMSGDVDEQGWRYSWSFSSTAWHGTHPWFHSFVRRRRWVRMRSKAIDRGVNGGRSGFEKAHMLNEDYFTIHSCRERSIADAAARTSKLSSNYLSRASTLVDEEVAGFEEIADIPTLMYAFKVAIVDREKMEALKRFIHDGGEELYYLDEKVFFYCHCLLFADSLDPRDHGSIRLPDFAMAVRHLPYRRHRRAVPETVRIRQNPAQAR